ncbi:MAG: DUF308 domain-containing protein [Lachnospiraceae bacterium]|nr:DUF308 domain-containing protein [Lachnospiraceae bacterium]
MKDRMKRFKEAIPVFVTAVCELILGISLLSDPASMTVKNVETIGMLLIVAGAISIYSYFRNPPRTGVSERNLSVGILTVLLGLFCNLNSAWFATAFPEPIALYGVIMLVAGVFKTEIVVSRIRLKLGNWWLYAANAAVTVLCAALILFNPLGLATVLYVFAGLSFILEAVIDFTTVIPLNRKSSRKG